MADRTISIGFRLETGADGFQRLTMSANDLQRALRASVVEAEGLNKKLVNFSQLAQGINALQQSMGNLQTALNNVTEESRSFGDAMRAANTMAGKDAAGLGELRNEVTALCKDVPVARDALANGLYQVISNGVPENNWISFLEKSARSSIGGMADLNQVVGVTSTVIKNYGLEWDAAGEIQDKIQLTAKNGVTSFEQLAAALPRVTANAATLGVSVDELMASFATLTGVSGNTAEVSTQLAAIFTALVKPSSEATKMAAEMGIQFDAAAIRAAGGFQSFLSSLDQSVKAYSAASGVLEQEVYGKLFGSAESLRALIPLNGELAGTFSSNVSTMQSSAGTMDAAFEEMSKTGQSAAQALKNRFIDVGEAINSFSAPLRPFLNIGSAFLGVAANVGVLATSFGALKAVVAGGWITQTVMGIVNLATSAGRAAIQTQGFVNAARSATAAASGFKVALAGLGGVAVILGAISLAAWGVTAAMDAMNEKARRAEETQKMLNAVKEDAAKRLAEEKRQLELLVATAQNENISLDKRKEAVEELNRIIPDYNASIDETTGKYKASTQALNDHLVALRKKITLESMADRLKENDAKVVDLRMKREDALRKYNEAKGISSRQAEQTKGAAGIVAGAPGAAKGSALAVAEGEAWKELVDATKDLNAAIESGNILTKEWKRNAEDAGRSVSASVADIRNTDSSSGNGPELQSGEKHKKGKGSQTVTAKPELPEGSLADLERQVQDITAKIKLEVDPASIAVLMGQKENLEARIGKIKVESEFILNREEIISEIMELTVPDIPVKADVKMPDKLEGLPSSLEESYKKSQKLASGLGSIGSSLSQIGSNLDVPAIDVMGVIAGAIATMIQGYATATTQSSAMGPWAWIGFAVSGLATLTSVVASIKNLPKFADGGIAYGPTLGLFGEYAGASSNPEVVAPLDRLQSMLTPVEERGGRIVVDDIVIDSGKLRLIMAYDRRKHSRM